MKVTPPPALARKPPKAHHCPPVKPQTPSVATLPLPHRLSCTLPLNTPRATLTTPWAILHPHLSGAYSGSLLGAFYPGGSSFFSACDMPSCPLRKDVVLTLPRSPKLLCIGGAETLNQGLGSCASNLSPLIQSFGDKTGWLVKGDGKKGGSGPTGERGSYIL